MLISMKILVLLLLSLLSRGKAEQFCWRNNPSVLEMALGPSPLFPWLGLLRVNLTERSGELSAYTGVVMITTKYALAEAKDIVKIPKSIMLSKSRIMFILEADKTWFCKVFDYVVHPEFESSKHNTLSVLQLKPLNDGEPFRAVPICLPTLNYNFLDDLYAVEYVDDRNFIEKKLHKLLTLGKRECDEFYKRAEVLDEIKGPSKYICAFGVSSKSFCVWDNGVVMTSNATGPWVLVGFGIQGPGCAAPGKFINITEYLPWIQRVTTAGEDNVDSVDGRRWEGPIESAFRRGFGRDCPKKSIRNLPMHLVDSILQLDRPYGEHGLEQIGFTPGFHDYKLKKHVAIQRMASNQYKVKLFNCVRDLHRFSDPCKNRIDLTYHDQADFSTFQSVKPHSVEYWIAIYDMQVYQNFTCILITVESKDKNKPNITIADWLVTNEKRIGGKDFDSMIHKQQKFNVFTRLRDNHDWTRRQNNYLTAENVEKATDVNNLYIKVRFSFMVHAILEVEVYGKKTEIPKINKAEEKKNARRMMEIQAQRQLIDSDSPEVPPDDPNNVYRHFYKTDKEYKFRESLVPWIELDNSMMNNNKKNNVDCVASNVIVVVLAVVVSYLISIEYLS